MQCSWHRRTDAPQGGLLPCAGGSFQAAGLQALQLAPSCQDALQLLCRGWLCRPGCLARLCALRRTTRLPQLWGLGSLGSAARLRGDDPVCTRRRAVARRLRCLWWLGRGCRKRLNRFAWGAGRLRRLCVRAARLASRLRVCVRRAAGGAGRLRGCVGRLLAAGLPPAGGSAGVLTGAPQRAGAAVGGAFGAQHLRRAPQPGCERIWAAHSERLSSLQPQGDTAGGRCWDTVLPAHDA